MKMIEALTAIANTPGPEDAPSCMETLVAQLVNEPEDLCEDALPWGLILEAQDREIGLGAYPQRHLRVLSY